MHSVHCTLRMGLASGLGRAASLGVREVNNKSLPDAEWGGLHLASKIKRTEHKLKLFSQIIVKLHFRYPFLLVSWVGGPFHISGSSKSKEQGDGKVKRSTCWN